MFEWKIVVDVNIYNVCCKLMSNFMVLWVIQFREAVNTTLFDVHLLSRFVAKSSWSITCKDATLQNHVIIFPPTLKSSSLHLKRQKTFPSIFYFRCVPLLYFNIWNIYHCTSKTIPNLTLSDFLIWKIMNGYYVHWLIKFY